MKCLNYIKHMDYLSNEVKLTISKNGDTRLKTIYGGFLSFLSVIISTTFALYFFISLINKDNIYLTLSNEVSHFSNLTDSNNLPFLIRLTDKSNVPFESPNEIYKIYLKYWYGGSNSSLENVGQKTVDIDIEPCDLNIHFDKYKELFLDVKDLHTFYCPRPRQYNETIYGIYGDVYPFGYYHFYVAMCYQKDYCKPLSEIKQITSNVYLDFRTVDFSINNRRKQAKTQMVLTERYMLSSSVYKRIWFYFSGINYFTDTGLFFSQIEEDRFSKSESMRYDIDHRDIFTGTIPGTFVTMTMVNTGTVYIYNRKYLKIQDYIATIGGIVKFVQVVAFLLNYIFSKNTYYVKFITDLHVFQKINKMNTASDKIYNSFMKSNFNIINIDLKNEVNDSKINLQEFKTKFELNEKMKKWYYKLIPYNILWSHQAKLIQKSIDIVNANMNIIAILTKIEENHFFVKELMCNDKMEHSGQLSCSKNHEKKFISLKPLKNLWLQDKENTNIVKAVDIVETNIKDKNSG